MMKSDTIAAISTGIQTAGLSVIRVSGPQSLDVLSRVFTKKRSGTPGNEAAGLNANVMTHGYMKDGDNIIDEVMIVFFKGPRSFTGEDTVEINCHGGVYVTKRILNLLLENGARLATPGEFSRRSFMNGRMDMTMAESVIDVIHAENEYALKAGISGLSGEVSGKIREIRERILDEIARIEAGLDDPEHYDLFEMRGGIRKNINDIYEELSALLHRSREGAKMMHGIRVTILGKPNAGKSSFLNYFAGADLAIVTDIPGTTRDIMTVPLRLGEYDVIFEDTAGLRETSETVEKIGVERAKAAAERADFLLFIIGNTDGDTEEELKELSVLDPLKTLVIINKSDIRTEGDPLYGRTEISGLSGKKYEAVPFSALTGEGREKVIEKLSERFSETKNLFQSGIILSSERNIQNLTDGIASLAESLQAEARGDSEEFLTIGLNDAYGALSEILGEEISDDVIDRVFSKFCMGK